MGPWWHELFQRLQAAPGDDDLLPPAIPGQEVGAKEGEAAAPRPRCSPCRPSHSVAAPLAALLAVLYGGGARARRALYAHRILKAHRLPAPVVSVGNLTVGGTGKTPVVACLAQWWRDQGKKMAILSRGYGGQAQGVTRLSDGQRLYHRPPEVGEEAYWLARTLPGVAVYTGANRYAAGLDAWRDLKPGLFLLDDGFQHFQLHRDLDIVLLDAAAPFGNGRLLPRGPLREPTATLAAAQVLILTRYEAARHRDVLGRFKAVFPEKPVLTAAIAPLAVRIYPGAQEVPLQGLKQVPLFAFAGLARPQVFCRTLSDLAVDLKGWRAFPDHYALAVGDRRQLVREARASGAAALITTAKDWARLGERWEADLPLWVLEVEAQLSQPDLIPAYLDRTLENPA